MIEELILNKILQDKSLGILKRNHITEDLFLVGREQIDFIIKHHRTYGVVPDKITFLDEFGDFDIVEVSESEEYLIYKLREAFLFKDIVPVLKQASEVVRDDSIKGLTYLMEKTKELIKSHTVKVGVGYDLMENAEDRLIDYKKRLETDGLMGISTGIKLLDELLHGWVGEDLVVLFARTNKGKTWIMLYFLTIAWKLGFKVVMYSGEMSRNMIGFRVDTLNENFSNMGLMNGNKNLGSRTDNIGVDDYAEYVDRMSREEGFIVVTPKDFGGNKPTVDDLCEIWDYHNGDILGVDQLSLMGDQRKGESKTVRYGNISEDLFLASEDRQKPIILLAQAGRESEKNKKTTDETPELHHIEYSDAVGQNATRVISMNVVDSILKLSIKKNRYGLVNKDVLLMWDINFGIVKPLLEEGSLGESDYGF